ncbi:hypothetical protein Tco_0537386 [Tanacetum coccineum]
MLVRVPLDLCNEKEVVGNVMDIAYALVERLSILGSNINDFVLYCPIIGTKALNSLVVSGRNFFDGGGVWGGCLVKVFCWLFAFRGRRFCGSSFMVLVLTSAIAFTLS